MGRHSVGEFEHLILLGILRLGDDAYGVTIINEVEERTGRDISHAAAYLTLRRLQDKGWIEGRWAQGDARRAGRRKRYYLVTAEGREKLREARSSLLQMWSGIVKEIG